MKDECPARLGVGTGAAFRAPEAANMRGRRAYEAEPRPLRSLKGGTAGRVVRALRDFDPPYGVRELAEKASTPLGSVARVVELLDRDALVERNEAGRIERVRRPELVRRWTQDYSPTRS